MRKFIVVAALAAVLGASSRTLAADLYVNNGHASCSDATTRASNSQSSPWCTIGRAAWGSTNRSSPNAAQAAQAGDVVYVMAGTYTTSGTGDRTTPAYNPANSGTPSAPIVFEAVGVVLLRQTGSGPVVGANGNYGTRNYITWRGFTINEINAMSTSDTGPVVLWSTTGSRVENFVIDGFDNGVNGNNHNGIRLENVTDVVIRNNRIFNVLNYGSRQMNGAGIMAYFSNGAIIEHNEIFNCGSGIFIKGGNNANFTVRYNEVYETAHGVLIQYTATSGLHRIYQNVLRANDQGIAVRLNAHNVSVVNNTVINNAAGIHIIHWQEPISNIVVQNNIVRQNSGEVINGGEFNNVAQVSLDRNNYHGSLRWSIAGVAYSSLSGWRSALGGCPGAGNDCSAVTTDPMFVDLSAGNFRLQSGSPALTIGIDILDLNGNGNTTDVIPAGAYITGVEVIGRFSGAAPPPPPSGPPSPPTGVRIVQ